MNPVRVEQPGIIPGIALRQIVEAEEAIPGRLELRPEYRAIGGNFDGVKLEVPIDLQVARLDELLEALSIGDPQQSRRPIVVHPGRPRQRSLEGRARRLRRLIEAAGEQILPVQFHDAALVRVDAPEAWRTWREASKLERQRKVERAHDDDPVETDVRIRSTDAGGQLRGVILPSHIRQQAHDARPRDLRLDPAVERAVRRTLRARGLHLVAHHLRSEPHAIVEIGQLVHLAEVLRRHVEQLIDHDRDHTDHRDRDHQLDQRKAARAVQTSKLFDSLSSHTWSQF